MFFCIINLARLLGVQDKKKKNRDPKMDIIWDVYVLESETLTSSVKVINHVGSRRIKGELMLRQNHLCSSEK